VQKLWSKVLFNLVIKLPKPKVVDADALRLLSKSSLKNAQWVLTPHFAEAVVLLSCSIAEVEADRFSAVKK
jgi:NAD(P)H-hydrate repair Nnr-like enzyme with NAD(P)H-hydrate dehydratase domain